MKQLQVRAAPPSFGGGCIPAHPTGAYPAV